MKTELYRLTGAKTIYVHLIVVIRVYGGLQECVMFAILFMNGITPLINRITQPRQFGG